MNSTIFLVIIAVCVCCLALNLFGLVAQLRDIRRVKSGPT